MGKITNDAAKNIRIDSTTLSGVLRLDSNIHNVRSYYCDGVATVLVGDGIVKMGFHEVFPEGDDAVRLQNVVINMPTHRVSQMIAALQRALEDEDGKVSHGD